MLCRRSASAGDDRANARPGCTPTRPTITAAVVRLSPVGGSSTASPVAASRAANVWAGTGGSWSARWPGSPSSAASPSATSDGPTSTSPSPPWPQPSSSGASSNAGFVRGSKARNVLADEPMGRGPRHWQGSTVHAAPPPRLGQAAFPAARSGFATACSAHLGMIYGPGSARALRPRQGPVWLSLKTVQSSQDRHAAGPILEGF